MKTETDTISAGWANDLLDEVAERGSGHTPDKDVPAYWQGGIKWISLRDSNKLDKIYISETEEEISQEGIQNSSAVLHPTGSVVLSRDAGVGKSAITTQEMAVSQHFVVWKCSSKLNNHYLYYWLQLMKPEFERVAVGSTIKTIGLPYFKKLRITYPILMEEQLKIVEILMNWDSAINLTAHLIEAKRQLKRGLMQQLLTGKRRFPTFQQQEWSDTSFGQIFRTKCVRNTGSQIKNPITVGKYAIRPQHEHFKRIVASDNLENYNIIEQGDFVYDPMSAYYGAFGRYELKEPGIVSPVYRVLQINPCYDSDFIKHFIKSHYIAYQLSANSSQGNREGKRRTIQDEAFDGISFKISGIDEQRAIAQVLNACNRELALLDRKLMLLKQQKQGLMQQLLTGKIRVKT